MNYRLTSLSILFIISAVALLNSNAIAKDKRYEKCWDICNDRYNKSESYGCKAGCSAGDLNKRNSDDAMKNCDNNKGWLKSSKKERSKLVAGCYNGVEIFFQQ